MEQEVFWLWKGRKHGSAAKREIVVRRSYDRADGSLSPRRECLRARESIPRMIRLHCRAAEKLVRKRRQSVGCIEGSKTRPMYAETLRTSPRNGLPTGAMRVTLPICL